MRLSWLAIPSTLALWLLLTLVGLQQRLDHSIEDLLTRTTTLQPTDSHSVIIDVDDASLQALREPLGDWPYKRDVYALMLGYLRQSGARLVVMDIVFAGAREGDPQLAAALGNGHRAVLAAAGLAQRQRAGEEFVPLTDAEKQALQRLGTPGNIGLPWDGVTLPPVELLETAREPGALGIISAPLDTDGVLRQYPLLHRVAGQSLPSLALAARMRADGVTQWQVDQGQLIVGTHRWPVDELGRLRLRMPTADGWIPHIGWQRLMHAALGEADDPTLRQLLADRAVFVGSSAFFADEVMTPAGRLSGTALNAVAFETLGMEPAPLLRERGLAVGVLSVMVWSLGLLPLLFRRQLPAALLGCGAIGLAAWVAAKNGLLVTPAVAFYLLIIALLLNAIEHERAARQRERELTRERELAEARSRAKTELLAHVSHEMRTPMNAVLGFSDILARAALPADQARYVDLLGRAGRQVFDLINDLLDNARIESGRMELARQPFSLLDVVELQVELLRARAEAQGLRLRVFVRSPGVAWVLGDAKRVAQIVTNLVGNAIKFTSRGSVTVELLREDDGQVLIAVQDTGIGVAVDRLERIFRPFEQADAGIEQQFGGSGLGLAITRSLARLMGGDVTVRSTPDTGSRFEARLDLPVAESTDVEGGGASSMERITPTRTLDLLLAEDNDVNALVIEGMLMPLGHRITRACDGQQALDAMHHEVFDLVFMDMLMPGMDGLEATRRWRELEAAEGRPRMPMIALTANAYDSDVAQSLEAGCDAHLTKPVSIHALLQVLAQYAER